MSLTDDFDADVQRLTGLGATRFQRGERGIRYATLADPEGNEFDVIAGASFRALSRGCSSPAICGG